MEKSVDLVDVFLEYRLVSRCDQWYSACVLRTNVYYIILYYFIGREVLSTDLRCSTDS